MCTCNFGSTRGLECSVNCFNCQCVREGWRDKLKEQKDEGCQVYGYLEVNKVRMIFIPGGGGRKETQYWLLYIGVCCFFGEECGILIIELVCNRV